MRRVAAKLLPFFLSTLIFESSMATEVVDFGPWYTGPLLAPSGHTLPRGHTNLETYGFLTYNTGVFNNDWHLMDITTSRTIVGEPIFSHGLTDKIDIQYTLPYVFNHNRNQNYHHISDVSLILGYQLLEQNKSRWRPDLRVTIQEIFPTGKFRDLDPLHNGTDATGLGSYQTGFNLNFQHLLPIIGIVCLRSRLSLGYVVAEDVNLYGLSTFGGTPSTVGKIDPGNLFNADLAGELSLTQHIVAAMEVYYSSRDATKFYGFSGITPEGMLSKVGNGNFAEVSLAPALEYNFTANVGIIAGAWFSVKGKNAVDFESAVVALNLYI